MSQGTTQRWLDVCLALQIDAPRKTREQALTAFNPRLKPGPRLKSLSEMRLLTRRDVRANIGTISAACAGLTPGSSRYTHEFMRLARRVKRGLQL